MNTQPFVLLVVAASLTFAAPGTASDAVHTAADATRVAAASLAPQGPGKKPVMPPKLDMGMLKAFFGSEPNAPKSDNEVTDDKVALGRMLYHETSLSKGGDRSCATCHDLSRHGVDGKPTPMGRDGTQGKRNTPTTLDAFRQFAQDWDGRAATVEEQALPHALSAIGNGVADEAELVAKMKARPELVAAFAKAFPGDGESVTAANFALAIGAFERKLVTKSPFDEFLDGRNSALTTAQKIGLKTFIEAGCVSCHTSRLVGGQMFQKLGVTGSYPSEDQGRYEVTKNEAEKKMFKVPTLRNVAKTAPYFHDGAEPSLTAAIKTMAKIQLNKTLTDEEAESIAAFLEALTGALPDGVAAK